MSIFSRRKGRHRSHPPKQCDREFLIEATDGRIDRLSVAETSPHMETASMVVIVSIRKMLDAYFLPVSSATNYAWQCR